MKKRMTKLFVGLLISIVPVTNICAKIKMDKVSCGNITGIPAKIPELVSFAITLIQIAVPVILVVMGSVDLFKGITAQKEDEIKKGQKIWKIFIRNEAKTWLSRSYHGKSRYYDF